MTLTLLMAAAIAATAAATDTADRSLGLDEVVVTGTRAPRLLKDTPVQTRVITARDIERSDATNVEDLLQQQIPGVEFTYAMNQQTHMNFSGFGGQSVLFLVDGERLAGETMDDVDFSRLTMNGIERIEIVRGAASAIYGSNAVGGVVNIITRRPKDPWSLSAEARIGRHNEQRYTLTAGVRHRSISNMLTAGHSRISNYDVTSAPDPVARVVTTIYGDRTFNIADRLTFRPVDALDLTARAGYYFREVPRDPDTPDRYRDYNAGLRARWKITQRADIDASYSFDQYDKSSLRRLTGRDVRSYSNVLNSLTAVANVRLRESDLLTVGADYSHDYLMNTKLATGDKKQTSADAFVQYDFVADDRWEAVGAVRYDYFSDGDLQRVTPRLAIRYRPRYDMNMRLSYGMGFRAPTLKEKYYDFDMAGIWIVRGNPDLKAETSHNVSLSADWTHGNYNVTLAANYNRLSDKISTGLPYALSSDPKQLYLDYVNLSDYGVAGAELTLQGRWSGGFSARLAYSFTHESHPRDKDGQTANNQYIPSREHTLTASADWHKEFTRNYVLTLEINGRVLSGVKNLEYKDYYDIDAGTTEVKYPPYTIWRLSASQQFFSRIRLTVALDNLLNYKPKYHYLNAPLTDGLNIRVGLGVKL